ncbi:MAG: DNA-binding protein [Blastochloris viridis]|uniref:DNA-binding protein n=1 Tax=Blastochloris viridis TaxID=1079 RepID=A0A6N4R6T5_BLAVI|nr:MAG: DNA-binding protein [Blastochloris viridis]
MVDFKNLRTIRQLVEEAPGILTASKLRWWVYKADENGLKVALVRIGGRIYFDTEAFAEWLESMREVNRM